MTWGEGFVVMLMTIWAASSLDSLVDVLKRIERKMK